MKESTLKLICSLIAFIAALAVITGIAMCGYNVIMVIFAEGGSYAQAIAGFTMFLVGSFAVQLFASGKK